MKLYSVFLGFGFLLVAGASSGLEKCEGRSGLAECVYFSPNGTASSGYYCTSGGDFGDCGNVTNCTPNGVNW